MREPHDCEHGYHYTNYKIDTNWYYCRCQKVRFTWGSKPSGRVTLIKATSRA